MIVELLTGKTEISVLTSQGQVCWMPWLLTKTMHDMLTSIPGVHADNHAIALEEWFAPCINTSDMPTYSLGRR